MIADGLQAPEEVVQPEGHPGQGSVVTYVGRGPHPADVGPTEAAVLRVLDEIVIVVPVHKLVVERGQERNDGDESNQDWEDRKSTRLNSSHQIISYAVFCLKKKKKIQTEYNQ